MANQETRASQAETRRTGTTQFGRVLHDLNIELICANSSQDVRSLRAIKSARSGIVNDKKALYFGSNQSIKEASFRHIEHLQAFPQSTIDLSLDPFHRRYDIHCQNP